MTILVTGATGNVGRNVVDLLVRAGARVRALTRDPAKANLAKGAEVVRGDLAKPETLRSVFDDVDRMYLFPLAYLTQDVQSFSDVIVTTEIPELAKKAGVRRIVLLSSNAVMYGQDPHHQAAEEAVAASGLKWTYLRPGEFALNKVVSWGHSIRTEGVVRSGFPNVKGVPVHEADIAAVAATTLLEDGHVGAKYEITGPEALTEREQVAAITAGLGREIRFEELAPEQARQDWMGQGLPAELVDEIMDHYRHFDENPPTVAPTVEKITGKPARTLTQWASEHAADFR